MTFSDIAIEPKKALRSTLGLYLRGTSKELARSLRSYPKLLLHLVRRLQALTRKSIRNCHAFLRQVEPFGKSFDLRHDHDG